MEVVAPRRGASTFEAPSAEVRLTSAEAGTETMRVPASLARSLMHDEPPYPATRDQVLAFIEARMAASCAERVVRLQAQRDRSSREVLDRLVREGYPPEMARGAVEQAIARRVVDDARFAEGFCRAKVRAGWGVARIERELAARGVDVADLVGWPEDFVDEGDEFERALSIARRRNVAGKNALPRLARHLASKGFSTEVSLKAARAALEEADDGEDGTDGDELDR